MDQFIQQEKTVELSFTDMSSGQFIRITSSDMKHLVIYKDVDQAMYVPFQGENEYYSVPAGTYEYTWNLAQEFLERGYDVFDIYYQPSN